MIKKFILFLACCLTGLVSENLQAQGDVPENQLQVIIDTDMGLDDLRALALFMNNDHYRIRGIITSDGAVDPEKGAKNLQYLFDFFELPAGIYGKGLTSAAAPPPFRNTASAAFQARDSPEKQLNFISADEFYLAMIRRSYERSLIYICLGPLSNLSYGLTKYPVLGSRINRLVYAGNSPDSADRAWNTGRDTLAAKHVFGILRNITAYDPETDTRDFFNEEMIRSIILSGTPVGSLFRELHLNHSASSNHTPHLFLYDDAFAIYLQYPEFFQVEETGFGLSITSFEADLVRHLYKKQLSD